MRSLDLHILEDGISTGLSVRNGAFLLEAASVCLNSFNHPIFVELPVSGALEENYNLERLVVDELASSSFADLEEATQFGAMGIAVCIMHDQLGWKVKRSWKGTGFDYWGGAIGTDHSFKEKVRLEVSGDLEGSNAEVAQRLKNKLEQTKRSDELGLPAYAIIVEFSSPKSFTGSR